MAALGRPLLVLGLAEAARSCVARAHSRTVRLRTTGTAGDADTADLFTEVSRGVDKLLWLVEAHTQSTD